MIHPPHPSFLLNAVTTTHHATVRTPCAPHSSNSSSAAAASPTPSLLKLYDEHFMQSLRVPHDLISPTLGSIEYLEYERRPNWIRLVESSTSRRSTTTTPAQAGFPQQKKFYTVCSQYVAHRGECPKGLSCEHIHAAVWDRRVRTETIHSNLLSTLKIAAVLPRGTTLIVHDREAKTAECCLSEHVLVTKGSEDCRIHPEDPRRIYHCYHFHHTGICERGIRCSFLHVVDVLQNRSHLSQQQSSSSATAITAVVPNVSSVLTCGGCGGGGGSISSASSATSSFPTSPTSSKGWDTLASAASMHSPHHMKNTLPILLHDPPVKPTITTTTTRTRRNNNNTHQEEEVWWLQQQQQEEVCSTTTLRNPHLSCSCDSCSEIGTSSSSATTSMICPRVPPAASRTRVVEENVASSSSSMRSSQVPPHHANIINNHQQVLLSYQHNPYLM